MTTTQDAAMRAALELEAVGAIYAFADARERRLEIVRDIIRDECGLAEIRAAMQQASQAMSASDSCSPYSGCAIQSAILAIDAALARLGPAPTQPQFCTPTPVLDSVLDEVRDFLASERFAAGEITHTHTATADCPVCARIRVLDGLISKLGPAAEPLQPCGHPVSAIVGSDEGTNYCGECEREAEAKR